MGVLYTILGCTILPDADEPADDWEDLGFAMPRHWADEKVGDLNAQYGPLRRYKIAPQREKETA